MFQNFTYNEVFLLLSIPAAQAERDRIIYSFSMVTNCKFRMLLFYLLTDRIAK